MRAATHPRKRQDRPFFEVRDRLNERMDNLEARGKKAAIYDAKRDLAEAPETKFADLFQAEHGERDYKAKNVRLGALALAMAGGDPVRKRLTDDEVKAYSELTGPAGAVLSPVVTGQFIDAVRPVLAMRNAGAKEIAMRAPQVILPGWDDVPTGSWRAMGGDVSDAGGTFRQIRLEAQGIAGMVSVDREMLEDAAASNLSDVSNEIERQLGLAMAQAVDLAAINGSGANEPRGILQVPTADLASTATGGTPSDYSDVLGAIFDVYGENFTPSAWVLSPRTAKTFASLATGLTGDKTQLAPPREVAALKRVMSTQVPNDLGSGSDESAIIVGDFSRLVIGYRPSASLAVLTDPYTSAGTGQVRILGFLRADVGLMDAKAFSTIAGVTTS